jgi:hypothetical protein
MSLTLWFPAHAARLPAMLAKPIEKTRLVYQPMPAIAKNGAVRLQALLVIEK